MGDDTTIAPATDPECAKLRRIADEAPRALPDYAWAIPILLLRIEADAREAARQTIRAQVAEVKAGARARVLADRLTLARRKIRRLQWDLHARKTRSGPRCVECRGPRPGTRTRCAACAEERAREIDGRRENRVGRR